MKINRGYLPTKEEESMETRPRKNIIYFDEHHYFRKYPTWILEFECWDIKLWSTTKESINTDHRSYQKCCPSTALPNATLSLARKLSQRSTQGINHHNLLWSIIEKLVMSQVTAVGTTYSALCNTNIQENEETIDLKWYLLAIVQ